MDQKEQEELLARLEYSTNIWKKSEALRRKSQEVREYAQKILQSVKEFQSTIKKPPPLVVAFLTNAFLFT